MATEETTDGTERGVGPCSLCNSPKFPGICILCRRHMDAESDR